jgi:hypothetical protein
LAAVIAPVRAFLLFALARDIIVYVQQPPAKRDDRTRGSFGAGSYSAADFRGEASGPALVYIVSVSLHSDHSRFACLHAFHLLSILFPGDGGGEKQSKNEDETRPAHTY